MSEPNVFFSQRLLTERGFTGLKISSGTSLFCSFHSQRTPKSTNTTPLLLHTRNLFLLSIVSHLKMEETGPSMMEINDEEEFGDEFYEKLEAPKFVDLTAPDRDRREHDDRYWFCSRVGVYFFFNFWNFSWIFLDFYTDFGVSNSLSGSFFLCFLFSFMVLVFHV